MLRQRRRPFCRHFLSRSGVGLLRHRTVLGIFLGYFAYDYVWFVFVTWLPWYLIIARKFTTSETAFYSSVPYLIMMGVILLSGALSDFVVRRGRSERAVRKWFIGIGMCVACLIVPAGLVEDRMSSVALLTMALGGIGIASPNTWTLTQAMCARPIVGTVSGIQNFGGNLGGIVAPALTGYTVSANRILRRVVCGERRRAAVRSAVLLAARLGARRGTGAANWRPDRVSRPGDRAGTLIRAGLSARRTPNRKVAFGAHSGKLDPPAPARGRR